MFQSGWWLHRTPQNVLSHPKLKCTKWYLPNLGGAELASPRCLQLEHDGPAIQATSNMEGSDYKACQTSVAEETQNTVRQYSVTLFNGVSFLMIEGSQGTGSQHYNGSQKLISPWRIHLRSNPIASSAVRTSKCGLHCTTNNSWDNNKSVVILITGASIYQVTVLHTRPQY